MNRNTNKVEDIKRLEEGLFMCNELKEYYKQKNIKAIEYIKSNLSFVPKIDELIKILEVK